MSASSKKNRITVYIDPRLYIKFGQRVLEEKGKLPLSEKIVELNQEYLKS